MELQNLAANQRDFENVDLTTDNNDPSMRTEADKAFEDNSVTYFDIASTLLSVLVRFVSVVVYGYSAYQYYIMDEYGHFSLTMICIIFPALITMGLSVAMYMDDYEVRGHHSIDWHKLLVNVILVPFFFRYFDSLKYAVLCKRAEQRNDKPEQKRYFDRLIKEDSDVALVRIFECFLEAAPQKILQISIFLHQTQDITGFQIYAIAAALSSMTWALASYHRTNRFAQVDKRKMSWSGTIAQICWHFCITVSRIVSIVIGIAAFLSWTLIALTCHVAVMALWVFTVDRSPFCSQTPCHSAILSTLLGVVFIFTYILPKEGHTFYRYLFYYSICFVENVVAVFLYYFFVPLNADDARGLYLYVYYFLMSAPIVFFGAGIACMLVYYLVLHPNILTLS